MKKLRGSAILMIIAILGITGFQAWWLKNNYDREKENLDLETRAAFRQTILGLQASKLKLDKFTLQIDSENVRTVTEGSRKPQRVKFNRPVKIKEPSITVLNLIQERLRDSLKIDSAGRKTVVISMNNDSIGRLLIDSLQKMRGPARSIAYSKRLDSVAGKGPVIEEIQIEGSSKSRERVVGIGYDIRPQKREVNDTISLSRQGNMFIESPIPPPFPAEGGPGHSAVFKYLYDVDSLAMKDTVTVKEIVDAYAARLKEEKINVDFAVERLDSNQAIPADAITIGFISPATFNLSLENTAGYMFGKLKLPILFSLLLVGITILSFVLIYRNMLKQQRLAELKNEFISNITHELKTPIATVGVAIEALKSFNAIDNPLRTKEYLEISQQELQRLNLLVDKVLKLSMFEKKEVELKYETLALKDLVDEVVASMRLQIEKYGAQVTVRSEGDTGMEADRLHLLSVIFNLLDNALKYSRDNPDITIELKGDTEQVLMKVSDAGIGIPAEFKNRIFEKFFRVPQGNTHNAKGYGLGLSYTAHVIKKHKGRIEVESQPGQGTTFTVTLPKTPDAIA